MFPTIIFVGWVESREFSESEPSTFCVMNIRKKPQAAMQSSFNIEVGPVRPFRLSRCSLVLGVSDAAISCH